MKAGQWIEIGPEMRAGLLRAGEWDLRPTSELPPKEVRVYWTDKTVVCHPVMMPAVKRMGHAGQIPPLVDRSLDWRLYQ